MGAATAARAGADAGVQRGPGGSLGGGALGGVERRRAGLQTAQRDSTPIREHVLLSVDPSIVLRKILMRGGLIA